jgi:hypothetical protein
MKRKYAILTWILLLALCVIDAHAQEPDSFLWWTVELNVSVSGEYSYRSNNTGFDGKYSFSAVVIGSLDEDEGDYVFAQVYQEIKEITWKETAFSENSRDEFDLSKKIKPDITVNYVFRENGKLSFDFDIRPVKVPHKSPAFPKAVKRLMFPRSAGNDSVKPKKKYNREILNGSNRVETGDKDIYKNKELNPVFQWKWEEKGGASSWTNRHDVNVKMKIKRLIEDKEDKE